MIVPEALIKECKKYNKIAQRELYNRYVPIFRGICRRYSENDEDAKDIMQEGFIKIFSKISQYQEKGSFEGWMKRIIINTAITFYHKNKGKKEVAIDNMYNKNFELTDQSFSGEKGFEHEKSMAEEGGFSFDLVAGVDFSFEDLFNMMNELPKQYRDVFNLHCIENYKHKEIAELLKIDENTSRTRLLRARAQLQKILYQHCLEKIGK